MTLAETVKPRGRAGHRIDVLAEELGKLIGAKPEIIDVTLAAVLTGGHVLLEDVPGVGKTTFIKGLAQLLGVPMTRIQFTSDLLPADIVGVEIFDQEAKRMIFHPGPVFTHIVLADELNRASPRTQSALLEAMGEGSVTVDRKTYPLPRPFIVFASQNPADSIGTYEIPESQLDRFAARLRLGYPGPEREEEIFREAAADPLALLPGDLIGADELAELRGEIERIRISEPVATYVKRVVDASRSDPEIRLGISTRGGVTWLRMARGRAWLKGRSYVIPDDLQAFSVPVLAHRILAAGSGKEEAVIRSLLDKVDVH